MCPYIGVIIWFELKIDVSLTVLDKLDKSVPWIDYIEQDIVALGIYSLGQG